MMNRCETCKHWKQNTFYDYEGAINDGVCTGLNSKLAITLKLGWDGGYVDFIETESDFGCTLHKK